MSNDEAVDQFLPVADRPCVMCCADAELVRANVLRRLPQPIRLHDYAPGISKEQQTFRRKFDFFGWS
ncbi:hypothetical protein ACFSTD_00395 [Novosphingobium colocasiae]